jgi:N-acetylglucosamine kinase-like BadF-type ATPase
MRIIADSGSTKTNWHVLHPDGKTERFETIGLNPFIVRTGQVYKEIKSKFPKHLKALRVREIYFYGAGCSAQPQKDKIFAGLERYFPATIIHVHHDLLAAARALWGKSHGLIAIIGTGSSTALYDGEKVSEQIPSLGYILGDEGSGAYIGKLLLKSYLENELPVPLAKKFYKYHQQDLHEILENIYSGDYPNRFMGEFTHFIKENLDNSALEALVRSAFDAFFRKQILKYQNHNNYKLRCLGSVAYHFQEILMASADAHGVELVEILQDPLPRLIEYHNHYLEI